MQIGFSTTCVLSVRGGDSKSIPDDILHAFQAVNLRIMLDQDSSNVQQVFTVKPLR